MTLNYHKVWDSLNELESVTSKICSARAILNTAMNAHEVGRREETETLMYAVDEFLRYYLEEFDRKFKTAWGETVVKLKQEESKSSFICDKDNQSPECKNAWDDFWNSKNPEFWDHIEKNQMMMDDVLKNTDWEYEMPNKDKVKRWVLPIEVDGPSGEYYIILPDDLLEAANIQEDDVVEWQDNGDGSYLLKKVEKKTLNHDEAIKEGWSMTDDGFWIKEK